MVVRVGYYILAFHMDYIANTKPLEKLPAIFPIVVYNGNARWTAPEHLADLVETEPSLGDYGVQCRYFKIVENELKREQLLGISNLVSTLFLAEAHYDIERLIEEFVNLFNHEREKKAVSLLVNWFYQLMIHGRVQEEDYDALAQGYHSAQEVYTMLIEALEKEKEQIRQQGIEQGEATARQMIEQILHRRFEPLPSTVSDRLRRCTLVELNDLVNPALDVPTWEAFLEHLPQRAE